MADATAPSIRIGTSGWAVAEQAAKSAGGLQLNGVKSGTEAAALAAAAQKVKESEPQSVIVLGAPRFMADGVAALRKAGTMLFPPDLAALGTRYPEIAAPTLLLWGRQDELIGLGDGQKLEAALPNAALEIVESCGHIPHEERPTEAVPQIAAFLAAALPLQAAPAEPVALADALAAWTLARLEELKAVLPEIAAA